MFSGCEAKAVTRETIKVMGLDRVGCRWVDDRGSFWDLAFDIKGPRDWISRNLQLSRSRDETPESFRKKLQADLGQAYTKWLQEIAQFDKWDK